MKFLSNAFKAIRSFKKEQKPKQKTVEEYQQDMLIKLGREQFKKLTDKGLQLPIAVL